MAANPAAAGLDRSLSCRLTDLDEVVARAAERRRGAGPAGAPARAGRGPKADIRLTMKSDDLIALTDGELQLRPAWATGRVKLEAGLRDLLRLRKIL